MLITIFQHDSTSPTPGKHYALASDGTLTKKTVGSRTRATASKKQFSTLYDLANFMASAKSTTWLTAGVGEHESSIALTQAQIKKLASRFDDVTGLPVTAYTEEDLPFPDGAGLMTVDADGSGDAWGEMVSAIPKLADINRIIATSSGSNIYQGADELRGVHGQHIYLHVADASDIPRALQVLHKRCVLAGYGRHKLSVSGAFLRRSAVDQAMRQPAQPIFLKATVGKGLKQKKDIKHQDAGMEILDTRKVIPDLTVLEEKQYERMCHEAEQQLKPKADAIREKYIETRVEHAVRDHGIDRQEARDSIELGMNKRVLNGEFTLCTADGEVVTVKQILANPAEYDGQNFRDPWDWNYGSPTVAKLYANRGYIILSSFAHSGGDDPFTYLLSDDDALWGDAEALSDILAGFDSNDAGEEDHEEPEDTTQDASMSDDADHTDETDNATEAEIDTDELLLASRMPVIDEAAFYGPLRHIVEAATKESEATKVGVAIHTIVTVASIAGRPFYLPIGDERVGLNIFALQVGESATGRKGTSASFADKVIAPGIERFAQEMKDAFDESVREYRDAMAELTSRQRRIEMLQKRLARLELLDDAMVAEELEDVPGWKEEIEVLEPQIETFKNKLKETLSPASLKDYGKALNEATDRLLSLQASITAAEERHKQASDDLVNRETLLIAIPKQIQVEGDELAAAACANKLVEPVLEPWLKMIMDFSVAPIVMSGVSSGEGIIESIRDPREVTNDDGEIEFIPGVDQKKLLLNLGEYGSMLSMMRRPGGSMSAVYRLAYDGAPLETNSRHSPVSAKEHHICVSGAITPDELQGMMFDEKDQSANASNGVGNRNLYVHVARTKLVAIPKPTAGGEEFASLLFNNIGRAYGGLKPTGPHRTVVYPFTPAGEEEWNRCYHELDSMTGVGPDAAKLFGRLTTAARKLGAVLAMMSGEPAVGPDAVRAALAWCRYGAGTINAVAAGATDRRAAAKLKEDCEKVLAALRKKADGQPAPARMVRKAANLKKKEFDAAVTALMRRSPPMIRISEVEVTVGKGAKRKKSMIEIA